MDFGPGQSHPISGVKVSPYKLMAYWHSILTTSVISSRALGRRYRVSIPRGRHSQGSPLPTSASAYLFITNVHWQWRHSGNPLIVCVIELDKWSLECSSKPHLWCLTANRKLFPTGQNVNKGVYSFRKTVKLKRFFNIHNCYQNCTQKLDHYIIFHFRMTLIK